MNNETLMHWISAPDAEASQTDSERLVGWACAAAAAAAALALVGRWSGVPLLAGGVRASPPMAPAAAAVLLLLCAALHPRTPAYRRGRLGLLVPAFMIAAASFTASAPWTGACFFIVIFAAAVHIRQDDGKTAVVAAHALTLAAALSSSVLFCYLYAGDPSVVGALRPMPAAVAACVLVLSGALLVRRGRGIWPWSLFQGDSARAMMMRTFVPLTGAFVLTMAYLDYRIKFFESSLESIAAAGVAVLAVSWMASVLSAVLGERLERAERGLRENGARCRTLFEQAGDAILVLEMAPDGPPIIRDANIAAVENFGYSLDELVDKPITFLDPEALDPGVVRECVRQTASFEGGRFEALNRCKDGSIFATEVTTKFVEIGGSRYVVCVGRDINARKTAEAFGEMAREIARILGESGDRREQVRRLVDALRAGSGADAVAIRLQDGADFPYFSCAGARTGETAVESAAGAAGARDEAGKVRLESVCGLVLSGRTDPGDPMFTPGGSFWTNDCSLLLKNGACAALGCASVGLVPIRIKDRILGLIEFVSRRKGAFSQEKIERLEGIAAHIGEALIRRRAEDALERLNTAIEQTGEAVLITSPKGEILYANPAFETATGYTREEVLGRNPRFLRSGEHDDAFYGRMWETILSGRTWKGRLVNKRKDGTLFTEEASISPVRDASGTIVNFVAVKRDISGRLKMEEELRHSQKMESVGRLAGGVAHDFNNILTSIKGYTEFAMADLAEGDQKRDDLKEVMAASERAVRLTRQLLAFSRKQILKPQIVDINADVGAMTKLLKRLIGEDIGLTTRFVPRPCLVMVDAGQMEQVFLNLAVNARDAMPKGGTLTFETSILHPAADFSLAHPDLPAGPLVCVSAADTGCGMSAAVMEHLFEPFFTTKEKGKGTGLGLSMVYGIVKQSGGDIDVESAPGRGTTFRIYFPLLGSSASARAEEGGRDAGTAGSLRGNEIILLVEDEDHLRRLGERVLTRHGYAVLTASNGAEALKALERCGRGVDLLFTDVVMPGMSGRELAQTVAARKLARRTLFVSGFTDDAILQHGVLEPGLAFLYKPFTPLDLLRKTREVLDGPVDQARA